DPLAFCVPSSSFSTIVPAVAVYFTSCPPIFTECFVCTLLSSGAFLSSFAFSPPLSEDLSAAFSPPGCCAIAKLAQKQKTAAAKTKRSRVHIVEKPSQKQIVATIAPAKSYATPPHPSM